MRKLQILMLLTLSLSCFNQHLYGQKGNLKSEKTTSLNDAFSKTENKPPLASLESTVSILERMFAMAAEAQEDPNSLINGIRDDGRVIHLSLIGTERWNVYLGFSANRKYAFVVFPCKKAELDSKAIETLLLENQRMGMSRFETSNDQLRITTSCELQELDAGKLNRMLWNNISEARRTMSVWSNRSEKVVSNPAPTNSNRGTTPKVGSTPSAGTTPELAELTEICTDGGIRIGTMELKSVKDMNYFGAISFAPDFTFSMKVEDVAKDSEIVLEGTYRILEGKLHLIVKQPNTDKSVRFTYLLRSRDGDKMILRSEEGGLDTISL